MSAAPCRVVRRHLDAWVDGELETSVQVEFDSHLAGCQICREHAAFSRSIKKMVKSELASPGAPDHLRQRLMTALASAEPHAAAPPARPPARNDERVRVRMLPARYVIPAAAAVMFVALGTQSSGDEGEDVAAASTVPLFEDLVRRHSSEPPAEVQGPPQQVEGWFRGKLDFPVHPVEFENIEDARLRDPRLIGARLSNVREQDAAAFYYQVHGRRLTVTVFELPRSIQRFPIAPPLSNGREAPLPGVQRVTIRGRPLFYRQVRGYTVPMVEHDGLTYAFTGDLDAQSMMRLAASARVAN